ncbi:MAG: ribosomal RNA small subunit methyltransferase A [Anaerolineae bacterium]|nr:ribosomal RNA small subunit methyltransferase A [Anaerolineae bacterium]
MWARKSLGQHFLLDNAALDKIVAAAELTPDDTVVEIGPGPGPLTRKLADAAGRVIAVELDERMVDLLRAEVTPGRAVEVVQGDILQTDLRDLVTSRGASRYKVVANLPYYITSAALRHILEASLPPTRVVVLVQREVAERIVARPPDMSLLAVSVQLFGAPRIVARVPAGAFYPPPKVDSAIVRLGVYPQPAEDVTDVVGFFEVTRAGFGQKRKQLRNSLSQGLRRPAADIDAALRAAAIDPTRRAETLTLAEWSRLQQALASGVT